MNLKFTGTSIKQADSSTQGDPSATPYRQLCFDLQSMTLVGKKAYCIKINKYYLNPDDKKYVTDKAEIHIYQDYSKGETKSNHHYISVNNNMLGHANGVTYYNGALYVAINSHGQVPEYKIIKVVFNSSETAVEEMVGYSLEDSVLPDKNWNLKVRGIAHYKDNQFILMINPIKGVHYSDNTPVYNPMFFKIATLIGDTFHIERTFYVKNIGEEITQDISYCKENGKLYIVTCNRQVEENKVVKEYIRRNNVLELEIDKILLGNNDDVHYSQITFNNRTSDYYVPSNVIVLNRLNSTQKIFEMQSCCVDTTNRRLVYAIDTKSTAANATVLGEIYMVNNLLTKL